MNRLLLVLAAASAFTGILAGCRNTQQSQNSVAGNPQPAESAIVTQFKAAGGGDAATADLQGLGQFLGQHPDLSRKLIPACNDRQKTANANWNQTAEGKICSVAGQVVSLRNFYGLDAPANKSHKGTAANGGNSDKRTYGPVPNQR